MASTPEDLAAHFNIRNPAFNDPDLVYDVYKSMLERAPS